MTAHVPFTPLWWRSCTNSSVAPHFLQGRVYIAAKVPHSLALLVSPHFLALCQTRPSRHPHGSPSAMLSPATLDHPTFPEDASLSYASLLLQVSLPLGSVLYQLGQANLYPPPSKLGPCAQLPEWPGHTLYKPLLAVPSSPLHLPSSGRCLAQGSVLSIQPSPGHLPGAQ